MTQELTPKEQMVVERFEQLRPGYGEIARKNILSPYLGYRELIAQMSEEEITLENLEKATRHEASHEQD
jgi:hypothetical protein